MPMARSVPISRVRSRMAIHSVFMMPTAMMTSSTNDQHAGEAVEALMVHLTKEISSSQLVMSSFCPSSPRG